MSGPGTRQSHLLNEFDRSLDEEAHAQAHAANPTPVVIQDGIRGILGAKRQIVVGTWQELVRFKCGRPHPLTIQSNVGTMFTPGSPGFPPNPIPPLQGPTPSNCIFPRAMLRVRVGSGNALGGSDRGEYFVPAGSPFEVAGTDVTVDGQIFANEDANNLGPSGTAIDNLNPETYCLLSVTIAEGQPRSNYPTKWIHPQFPLPGAIGGGPVSTQAFTGPGRIKQVHGFNAVGTSSAILYLMLFDIYGVTPSTPIPDTSFPLFTIPVPGGSTPFSWDCIESDRFFQLGLAWGISTTPDRYTALVPSASTGVFRVDIELYAAAMQTLTSQPNA